MKIIPGNSSLASDIKDWYSLDIGFSSKRATCGIFRTDTNSTKRLHYGEVSTDISDFASTKMRIGLIIEAPLSYSFNASGNPCGRSFEEKNGKTRYWYAGLGACVMNAAMFLLQQLHQSPVKCELILFEGFLSFKDTPRSDEDDARRLYKKHSHMIDPSRIKAKQTDSLSGIADVFGGPSDAPGVIVA